MGSFIEKCFHQVPPKVECPSELGMTLLPIIEMMYDWEKRELIKLNKKAIKRSFRMILIFGAVFKQMGTLFLYTS